MISRDSTTRARVLDHKFPRSALAFPSAGQCHQPPIQHIALVKTGAHESGTLLRCRVSCMPSKILSHSHFNAGLLTAFEPHIQHKKSSCLVSVNLKKLRPRNFQSLRPASQPNSTAESPPKCCFPTTSPFDDGTSTPSFLVGLPTRHLTSSGK